jgi:hypothetical protein
MRSKLFKLILFVPLFVLGRAQLLAQENNEATLKGLLASKTFIFKAQSAWPLQGTVVQLTPGFDMKILDDSINTYLPYFGRAYAASYNGNGGGGINFTTTKFEYKLKEKSKGGWEIVIKPSDVKEINELIYSISTNGFATLQVTSNNRQAISFYGIIEKR